MHEVVEITMGTNDLGTGTQHEMEGIAENDLRPHVAQFLRCHGLDRAVGPHRHKGRRLHHATCEAHPPPPRRAIIAHYFKLHRCHFAYALRF